MGISFTMKPDRKESEVLSEITRALKVHGWRVHRMNNGAVFNAKRGAYVFHGTPGFPDLVAIKPGLFHGEGQMLLIECKSEKGKQSDAQKEFEQVVKNIIGVRYILARCWNDVGEVIGI